MNSVKTGLKENWKQFALLVVINAFVGGMVGLERTIIPQLGEEEFGMTAKTAVLSFIIVFGMVKALTNFYAGTMANRFGRKNLLVTGWLFAIPVPFLLIYAENWQWVIAANIFLGINQGLAWSSTVVMKIDLAGEKERGFAMGLNEFAGYIAVAAVAFGTGWIADAYGLRPYPFYIGIAIAIIGLLMSWLLVRDTHGHVALEASVSRVPRLRNVFWETTWKHPNLGSITQAGLINNLNDGMIWGLFPLLLAYRGFDLHDVAIIVAIYPATWGTGQLITGRLADIFCKKNVLFWGMLMQGGALLGMAYAGTFAAFAGLAAILGIGTSIVYPTFLAAVSDFTHPSQRPQSIGIFRLWRDSGYAIGALMTGLIADRYGLLAPVFVIAVLTILSSVIIRVRMTCATSAEGEKLRLQTY